MGTIGRAFPFRAFWGLGFRDVLTFFLWFRDLRVKGFRGLGFRVCLICQVVLKREVMQLVAAVHAACSFAGVVLVTLIEP